MKLKDKVAIVTGAAMGIGSGIAKTFSREGALVVIADINESVSQNTLKDIRLNSKNSIFIRTDVKKSDDIQGMIKETIKTFGKLDILVNNVGYFISKNVEDTSEEEWDFIQNTNLKSTFLCCKYVIPYLRTTKGNIINISSMVGVQGMFNSAAYSATKAGQIALTKGMAIDFGPIGIRVNAICPAYISTPLAEDWWNQIKDGKILKKQTIERIPVKRFGTIEECGQAALFLASDDASYITGAVLSIDGGVTLGF